MAQDDDLAADESLGPDRRRGRMLLLGALLILVLLLAYVWVTRKSIADNYLASELEKMGLPGTYEVAHIGPDEQIVRNLVIGDPARPDLTVAEVRVATRLRFGFPGVGRITLVRPRLYGRIRQGRPSFGTLDKVLFTGSKEPFRLPDLDLAIDDGRALMESDYGLIGLKLDGKGLLRDGFAGELAAIAPRLNVEGCTAQDASVYGRLSVSGEKPRFSGPMRLAKVACSGELSLSKLALQADVTLAKALDAGEGKLSLTTGPVIAAQGRAQGFGGTASVSYGKGAINARYDVAAYRLSSQGVGARRLAVAGRIRSSQDLKRFQVEADVVGEDLTGDTALDGTLAQVQRSADGTLVAPLLARFRAGLARETRTSRFDGAFIARRGAEGISLVVPRARLKGSSGQSVLSLSRVQILARGGDLPHVAGSFVTGGTGIPRIDGRLDRAGDGSLVLNAQMARYAAADAGVAVPELKLVRSRSGSVAFAGVATVSGALPGGRADNLVLPLDGSRNKGALSLWRRCVDTRFNALAIASLRLDRRRLTICPAPGRAMVTLAGGRMSVAGGISALDVTGRLGSTPIRIASGPVGFAYPGVITARALDVALGPPATASRFRIANLDARAGRDISGRFDGSDVSLYAVPLDLHAVEGQWRYAGGVLTLGEGSFRLEDREQVDRFQPLVARDARLTLRNNVIDAEALLREPSTDRAIVLTTIRHDLSTAKGHADLAVREIAFDDRLQPETLTRLALGVIAQTKGTVRGSGRIDWDEAGVRSTGAFTTDRMDFAAAFGPVQGVAGTIRFTDLLGLVTAPNQQLRVASINPGIEVNDGVITYTLRPGYDIDVAGGTWPFVGGTLRLLPTSMRIGSDDVQRYTLEVTGADAALFVQRMELGNLNATGIFDGTLPLVFDQGGGRIEGGLLRARPPGGNVSYVGELTYKDLSAMANFAFAALRSLNYQEMSIVMNGALEGEIVTRLSFSGVSQGEGTSQNFLTRRIARLPIRFNVNLRAPFLQLLSSFKSLYDPAYVRDPRSLGIMDDKGRAIPRLSTPPAGTPPGVTIDPARHSIQPIASETMP